MTQEAQNNYGEGDATYQAAGGEAGIRRLVDCFYNIMQSDDQFAVISNMHPSDKSVSRDKLSRFLCAWMGGPRLYNEKYGAISIPGAHAHLAIGVAERDQWLSCMGQALGQQETYPESLVNYLLQQLKVPADRIVAVIAQHKK